jgi:DNA-binding CsgD family transcriptional regulator
MVVVVDTQMLEREAELAALRQGIEAAGAGSSGFVLVSGPAGVGKTSLLKQGRRLSAERGLRVLAARGSQLEREYAFGVVRQLFEPLLAGADEQQRREWLSGTAGAAGPVLGQAPSCEAPQGDFTVLHALYWLTSNVCLTRAVAMVMDDLHWADEPSLRFLAYLLPRLDDQLPIVVMAGVRSAEPGATGYLLDLITADPACQLLRPASLSPAAASTLLSAVYGRAPERGFVDACHAATRGNPLLLGELARAVAAEGLEPIDVNAAQVQQIGSRAVSRRVTIELGRLQAEHVRLAEVIAVLGEHATITTVAQLAEVTRGDAAEAVDELTAACLVQTREAGALGEVYEFVHPLLRTAVYEHTDVARRIAYHVHAAQLLTHAGARPEQVAAHLLPIPGAGDGHTVSVLRHAAADALARGAADAAHTYLRRALAEPPPEPDRLPVLAEAARAALPVDLSTATEYLDAALAIAQDSRTRAQLTSTLGFALVQVDRIGDAVSILTKTIDQLPPDEDDLRRGLEAILLDVPLVAVGWESVFQRLPALRRLPPAGTPGALQLDCMIAGHDAYAGTPGTTDRVRRSLNDPCFVQAAAEGVSTAVGGYFTLGVADLDEGIAVHNALISAAASRGSATTLCVGRAFRGMVWLRRGELAEAEADLREALRLADLTRFRLLGLIIDAILAETLLEQGHIEDAESRVSHHELSQPLPRAGPFFFLLQARARVLRAQGRHEDALHAALAAGQRFAAHGGHNPAIVAWRSEAALCLYALDRHDKARGYAHAELDLARRWGAGYAVGRALRVAGLLTPGDDGLVMLREAVETLKSSPARLELAKALVDLGMTYRHANARAQARPHLAAGLELAHRCGATPLVERAHTELLAAGARPRRPQLRGPESLTPSERRVADLAAENLTNREIAQRLFVTPKTVEVHLSSTYRKLDITKRQQLRIKLAERKSRVGGTVGSLPTRDRG